MLGVSTLSAVASQDNACIGCHTLALPLPVGGTVSTRSGSRWRLQHRPYYGRRYLWKHAVGPEECRAGGVYLQYPLAALAVLTKDCIADIGSKLARPAQLSTDGRARCGRISQDFTGGWLQLPLTLTHQWRKGPSASSADALQYDASIGCHSMAVLPLPVGGTDSLPGAAVDGGCSNDHTMAGGTFGSTLWDPRNSELEASIFSNHGLPCQHVLRG